jgi:tripartite-type tricarboxylate transporter receptor subunit TctC
MRGEVLFAHDSVTAALPLIKSGRLRPLAVTGQERLQSLPDIPTYEEAGVKGMGITVWYCVMAPARTPKAIVDKLDKELTKMLSNAEVLARLRAVEFQPFPLDASRFKPFFADELKFWQRFVAESRR